MGHRRPFRFGVQLSHAPTSADWSELARRAEDLGYSTLFIPDHFGSQLAPGVALAAAAAAPDRLRVGTLVLDNDFRHPVVTAKEMASLDVLSDGRLELGIGAGWMTSDYDQSGMPMDPAGVRVDRLEEAIAVLKGLFAPGPLNHEGEHYRIDQLDGQPKPVQLPHPPLLVGGGGPRVLRLAAREAQIVGVNPAIRSGRIDAASAQDGAAATTDRKLEWVREAAGDRYDDIEINMLIFACIVTDDAASAESTVEAMAPAFGLDPAQLAEYPHAWIGTADEICERLEAGRERWDASYLVVQGPEAMAAAAPIVAKLAGA